MKKIFDYNININKTAYMNWRTDSTDPILNMNIIASAYFDSALTLLNSCLEDNYDKKADVLIFPVFFSINHGIELYVKSIFWSMNKLLGYNKPYPSNHNIRCIWYAAKDKIVKYGFGYGHEKNDFEKMIVTLESYLNELYENIMVDEKKDINKAYHNIDFSRYPLNNKYEDHFYLKECENVVVDLEYLFDVVTNIKKCLSSLADYYYYLNTENDM